MNVGRIYRDHKGTHFTGIFAVALIAVTAALTGAVVAGLLAVAVAGVRFIL